MKHGHSSLNNQRRSFIKQLVGGTLATISLTSFDNIKRSEISRTSPPYNDERYWEMVRKQFTISPHLTMVNAANLCPSPYFIQDQVIAETKNLGRDVSFQYREGYTQKRDKMLSTLAEFIGAAIEEVTVTRNTSEGNSFIVNGLDLKKGDEVILWDQNHPTNGIAWEHRAKRYGFTVKKISVPAAPASEDELVLAFTNAITTKTKLISFSHISNTSGIALPAKQICNIASASKIMTLVDGAQSFGMMDVNVKELGCDFYTASTHKWLMGPLENGVLYIKKETVSRVWPTLIGAGWKEGTTTVDEKFSSPGQRNEATLVALNEILEFHNALGKKNIEERVRKITSYLKTTLQSKIPNLKFISPMAPELSAGIVIVEITGKPSKTIFQKLYELNGIACAGTGGIRFSPHIYNSMEDMDKVVKSLEALSA